MPKKRVVKSGEEKTRRELPSRAAREKKRNLDGLFSEPSASPAPKKKGASKVVKKKIVKKKKKVTRKTKPSYQVMIRRAIKTLNNRNGSSLFAIYKHLEDNYPVPGDSFHRYVSSALKRGVKAGVFERVRLSYRLTAKGKAKIGAKKRVTATKKTDTKKRKRSDPKTKAATKKTSTKKGKKTEPAKKKAKGKEKEGEKEREKEKPKRKTAPKKTEKSDLGSSQKHISPAGHKFRWQYMDGSWKDYEMNASDLVENAYQGE